jgi:hypothetical protein
LPQAANKVKPRPRLAREMSSNARRGGVVGLIEQKNEW